MIVIRLASISLDPRDGRAVAIFVDDGGRCLPLWVEDDAAAALAGASRGVRGASLTAAGLVVRAVATCGGTIDRCELGYVEGGVLRGAVVVVGVDVDVLPTKASVAAAVAMMANAPLVVDDALLDHVNARLREASARVSLPPSSTSIDAPQSQTTAERWNALLEHLAERLHDDRPS